MLARLTYDYYGGLQIDFDGYSTFISNSPHFPSVWCYFNGKSVTKYRFRDEYRINRDLSASPFLDYQVRRPNPDVLSRDGHCIRAGRGLGLSTRKWFLFYKRKLKDTWPPTWPTVSVWRELFVITLCIKKISKFVLIYSRASWYFVAG